MILNQNIDKNDDQKKSDDQWQSLQNEKNMMEKEMNSL
jgi:hypothetical protein